MRSHTKLAIGLIVVGIISMFGYRFIAPYFEESQQKQTSDARATKGKIIIGIDNWIGYFPLCSAEMRKRMRRVGYLLQCEDDKANYALRMKNLEKGSINFAVATVDSYILNGVNSHYPGTIVAVIDESKGGDAVVAWKDRVSNLDGLKKRQNLSIAFTPSSPSEHLIKTMAVHFDIPKLRDRKGKWRVETEGSEQALKYFLKKKVDVAVLWEPDVSRALAQSGAIKILGTEDTNKLIVDILIVNRKYSNDNPEAVMALLKNYFRTLKHYRDNKKIFHEDAGRETKLEAKQVKTLLKGVSWVNLTENSLSWYGVATTAGGQQSQDGLIDSIEGAVQILVENKDFKSNPIPDQDPYRLTNSQFISTLYQQNTNTGQFGGSGGQGKNIAVDGLTRKFSPMQKAGWERLREIGTLKIRPIVFQSGTANLTAQSKEELSRAVENLKHYPNFRVVVKGHTGLRGDAAENSRLSQNRAQAVAGHLTVSYGIDSKRLRPIGFGSSKPLKRRPGESNRAFNYRLPRVELFLVAEDI